MLPEDWPEMESGRVMQNCFWKQMALPIFPFIKFDPDSMYPVSHFLISRHLQTSKYHKTSLVTCSPQHGGKMTVQVSVGLSYILPPPSFLLSLSHFLNLSLLFCTFSLSFFVSLFLVSLSVCLSKALTLSFSPRLYKTVCLYQILALFHSPLLSLSLYLPACIFLFVFHLIPPSLLCPPFTPPLLPQRHS